MTIKDRKSRESARLKQEIRDAALRIFAEQGYGKVSMRKIAALIEYSPTTIYRFFRNKEELLGAIAADTFGDLSARVEKVEAEAGDHPLGLLKSLVREYALFCLERPAMFRLFTDLASFELEDGVLFERLGPVRREVYRSWFRAIRRSAEAGHLVIRDDLRVFLFLWDAVNGYIDHRIRHARIPRKPPAEDAAEFLSLLFRGIEPMNPGRQGGRL